MSKPTASETAALLMFATMCESSAAKEKKKSKKEFGSIRFSVSGVGVSKPVSLGKDFKPSDRVAEVKRAIADRVSKDFKADQAVYFRGKPLANTSTLKDCGFVPMDKDYPLTVAVKLRGGAALPASAPKHTEPHVFDPARFPSMRTTKKADDLMCVDFASSPRVVAPCGKHAFIAETYYQLLRMMLREDMHTYTLRCPMADCGVEIPFEFARKAGMLTDDEVVYFLLHIDPRATKDKLAVCPTCSRVCEKPPRLDYVRVNCGKSGCRDFCFSCGKLWVGGGFQACGSEDCRTYGIQKTIECAPMVKLYAGSERTFECPRVRGCPKCLTLIEWTAACKHFTCPKCTLKFCFLCLKPREECKADSYTTMCELAPRQKVK